MSDQTTPNFDVVISGGGMIGLSLAAYLGQSGFKVALIERSEPLPNSIQPGQFSPRVSAINLASEQLLSKLGAWRRIPAQRRSAYDQMRVWDGLGSAEIHFDTATVNSDHLGHIIENNLIVDALWEELHLLPDIELFTSESIETWQQDAHEVRVQTQSGITLTSRLLIGCEGKHSLVRDTSNIQSWQWDYHHTAIVTTVSHEKSHHRTAQQVFLESGPVALLPLSDENDSCQQSSLVWSAKTERARELLAMSDQAFGRALEQAFEYRLGHVTKVDKRFSFELTAQQAKSYIDQRAVILGDAAHSIHPLAGLGVNMGFLDVSALAENLIDAKNKHTDIAHPFVLRRFQRRRQTHNLLTAGLMESLKQLYDTQQTLPVLARNLGLTWINRSSLMKRPLVLAAMGEIGPK